MHTGKGGLGGNCKEAGRTRGRAMEGGVERGWEIRHGDGERDVVRSGEILGGHDEGKCREGIERG